MKTQNCYCLKKNTILNYYIDQLQLKEIIGTISGNDTIMILTHSQSIAEYVYYKIFNHNYS
ncbi:hypothetical protein H6K62_01180 [Staphylococcus epidermidis]|nr:hypothetical protein [Staphylococcus epidermidis]